MHARVRVREASSLAAQGSVSVAMTPPCPGQEEETKNGRRTGRPPPPRSLPRDQRSGMAYIRPPSVHSALRPRGTPIGVR